MGKSIELKFTVLIEKNEEGSYTVTVPSLPGCITQGDTWDDAIANARGGYCRVYRGVKSSWKADSSRSRLRLMQF